MFWDIIQHYDEIATLWLNNSFHNQISDNLMILLSDKKVWFVMYGMIAGYLYHRLGIIRGIIATICIILTIVACDQTSNFIKNFIERLRPCYNLYMIENGLRILEGRANFFGFFSAHAANTFGFATASIICFKTDKKHKYAKYALFMITWAVLVSVSRIFVGKHFLGDIIIGAMVGVFYGYLCGKLFIFLSQLFNIPERD